MKRNLFLLCFLFVGSANAGVIDFEDIGVSPGDAVSSGGDRASGGFLFDSSTGHSHRINNAYESFNDTTWIGWDDVDGDNSTTMSAVSGAAFALNSLDLTEFFDTPNGTRVQVTGALFDGGTLSQVLLLDDIADGAGDLNDFQNIDFSSAWPDLASVTFDAIAGGGDRWFSLDNIAFNQTTDVLEPTSMALFGLALVGIGVIGRRRFV